MRGVVAARGRDPEGAAPLWHRPHLREALGGHRRVPVVHRIGHAAWPGFRAPALRSDSEATFKESRAERELNPDCHSPAKRM